MAGAAKSVLIMGLRSNNGDGSREKAESIAFVRRTVDSESEKARAAGYEVADCLVPADESTLDEVRQVLKSRQWDLITIGFGIRGVADLTPLFEKLVNTVIADVQPLPKFAFPAKIDRIFEAIDRVMGGGSS